MTIVESVTDKLYTCTICGASFPYKQALKWHRINNNHRHCYACGTNTTQLRSDSRGNLKSQWVTNKDDADNVLCFRCGYELIYLPRYTEIYRAIWKERVQTPGRVYYLGFKPRTGICEICKRTVESGDIKMTAIFHPNFRNPDDPLDSAIESCNRCMTRIIRGLDPLVEVDKKQQRKHYYLRHKDIIIEKQAEWKKKNPEKVLQYQKNYRESHKEQIRARAREYNRKYHIENKDKLAAYRKQYLQNNVKRSVKYIKSITCPNCNKMGALKQLITMNIKTNHISESRFVMHVKYENGMKKYGHCAMGTLTHPHFDVFNITKQ